MGLVMEEGCGIYCMLELMQKIIDKLVELQECFKCVCIIDIFSVFNIDLFYIIELGYGLNVVECMVYFVMVCKEFCGVYQCLDEGCIECDDVNFFKYIFVFCDVDGMICLEYSDVKIIMLLLVKCVYGGEVDVVDKVEVVNKKEKVNG